MRYYEPLEKTLRAAGWHPGRKVAWESVAAQEMPGVTVPAAAAAVLEEFSDLVIAGPNGMHVYFGADYGSQGEEFVKPISEALGIAVYPVASTNEGSPSIFVDENGRFYYLWVGMMYIGINLEAALLCLFDENWPKSLPTPPPDLGSGRWKIEEMPE